MCLGLCFRIVQKYQSFQAQWLLCVTSGLKIQKFYVLPAQCIDVFYTVLRTNGALCSIQHQRIGLCNSEGNCLLRGTN